MRRFVWVAGICAAIVGCARLGPSNSTPSSSSVVPGARYDTSVAYHTIFQFDGTNGADPESALIYADGQFYGTTKGGGTFGNGTVFSITPGGKEKVLYSFRGGKGDGSKPESSVTLVNGDLYGTTYAGGQYNFGTVYSVTLKGKERVLYRFGKTPDGQNPIGGLTALGGTLYGTTSSGGTENGGTVFSIKGSAEKVLYRFKYGARNQSWSPWAGLTAYKGLLYGTDDAGGHCSGGTIFSVTTSGKETTLHSFGCPGHGDGNDPEADLTVDNGVFYGTTAQGGKPFYNEGVVFSFIPPHKEQVILGFPSSYEGTRPEGTLVDNNGVLYGTTYLGGEMDDGEVFSVTTGGYEVVLHSFGLPPDGEEPAAGLVELKNTFYGTTTAGGGFSSDGTVYAITP